jgi:hypothetical protein
MNIRSILSRSPILDVFQSEYLSLVEQCMNFACELMDLCRGTQEVEAVLSEGGEKSRSRDPLARLKMAMEYEEKKVTVAAIRLASKSVYVLMRMRCSRLMYVTPKRGGRAIFATIISFLEVAEFRLSVNTKSFDQCR